MAANCKLPIPGIAFNISLVDWAITISGAFTATLSNGCMAVTILSRLSSPSPAISSGKDIILPSLFNRFLAALTSTVPRSLSFAFLANSSFSSRTFCWAAFNSSILSNGLSMILSAPLIRFFTSAMLSLITAGFFPAPLNALFTLSQIPLNVLIGLFSAIG